MRPLRSLRCFLAVLTLIAGVPAWAIDWHPGASLAWTSDYVFRGVSQSDHRPALQGGVHVGLEQWLIGAWASTVRLLPESRSTEINLYLGRQAALTQDLGFEWSWVHYTYADDPRPISYTYDELSAALNWLDAWLLRLSWSPNTTLIALPYGVKTQQQTLAIEMGYRQALPLHFDLVLGAGYYDPLEQHDGGYGFGNAGIHRQWGSLRAELNWFWAQNTSRRAYNPGPAGGPWVFTLIWEFP